MSKKEELAREQTRGLYIVGLLAVLITIKLTVQMSDTSLNYWFLIYLISSLAIYSLCMIFVFADITYLPSGFVIFFKELAWIMLWFALAVSIGYFALISITAFVQVPYTMLLYLVFAVAMGSSYYIKKKRQKKT